MLNVCIKIYIHDNYIKLHANYIHFVVYRLVTKHNYPICKYFP